MFCILGVGVLDSDRFCLKAHSLSSGGHCSFFFLAMDLRPFSSLLYSRSAVYPSSSVPVESGYPSLDRLAYGCWTSFTQGKREVRSPAAASLLLWSLLHHPSGRPVLRSGPGRFGSAYLVHDRSHLALCPGAEGQWSGGLLPGDLRCRARALLLLRPTALRQIG